jgi:hypothetical protein
VQNVVTERAAARVHYNLLDSHVAICAPQLLVVFADNFDYQEMAHLIKGVMERDEVSGAVGGWLPLLVKRNGPAETCQGNRI